MTEQKSAAAFDFEALRRVIEGKDARRLIGLYADDAELGVVNRNSPPSAPFVLRGKEAILEYLRDLCGRDVTHRIKREIVGEDRVAFNEDCEYPDGTRILCAAMLEVRDGKIAHQASVEAWDG